MKKESVIIIGSGLGGLSTALRLSHKGYSVTILEKHKTAGGRLNIIEQDGFKFDMGPSFMSMTYVFKEMFESIGEKMSIEMEKLEPLYQVFFEGKDKPRKIFSDLEKLQTEFADIEPDLKRKAETYLKRGAEFFHDTEETVVSTNFESKLSYFLDLAKVPWKHLPYLRRNIWQEVEKTFSSEELRIIFSLVAFFLGATPFKTPAIYSLLNYTEMSHDGYWRIKGGMYSLVRNILELLEKRNVKIVYNTEIVQVKSNRQKITELIDLSGKSWKADIIVSNSDAAAFRGKILGRKKYSETRLEKMKWTLAPFTIYLGVKGKIPGLAHHNYFLGSNFKEYASTIFTASVNPQKPYYYVNVPSISDDGLSPQGCENIFILCPVPDLRFKSNWDDQDELAYNLIKDFSKRINFDLQENILTKKILTPIDWSNKLNLYKGSGLSLAHNIGQVGAFRPANKDEEFSNLYYVGASTTPGTGLPMVVISSKLVTERILNDTPIS